jgi:D-lactate dehydrogenase (cytochrome)
MNLNPLAIGIAIAGLALLSIPATAEERKKKEVPKKDEQSNRSDQAEEIGLPKEFVNSLKKLLGDRFTVDKQTREVFGKDQSFNKCVSPQAVVTPQSTQEVSEIVKLCNQYEISIVPFGSGTSLEGHIQALHGGITINFQQMNQIVQLHKADMDIVVQPGLTYTDLNAAINSQGLFFPLDPGPGASIGGMVGTSCSGTNAVRYGTMKENIISLTAVLPDGSIVKTGNRPKKSSAGYDLTHLFVGAEGTLGVVTEITLRLHKIPDSKTISVCEFPTIGDAANAAMETIQRGIQIGKIELLDEVMLKAVNQNSGRDYKETPSLFMEFSGTKAQVDEQRKSLEEITSRHNGGGLKFAETPEERQELWMARSTALWSAPILYPGSEVKITDVCVPISRLAELITATKEDLKSSFLLAPIVGHVGDGNFHCFILVDPSKPEDLKEAKRLDHNLVERAISMEGTCTGEHGVGVGKRDYILLEKGEGAVNLMRTIKKAIDPKNIMNPGKIIPDARPDQPIPQK